MKITARPGFSSVKVGIDGNLEFHSWDIDGEGAGRLDFHEALLGILQFLILKLIEDKERSP